jgi:hypothetical protein
MASSQPATLGQYLARRGFTPNPGNPTWLDLSTAQQTVRVLHEPGETTLLYCLTLRSVCLYEAVFSPGTAHRDHRCDRRRTQPAPGRPAPG